MSDQAKILAKIELLKKKAATGDSHARAELDKLSRVLGMVTRARRQQEQQAMLQEQLMAQALAERIEGEAEGEMTAQYTPDAFDFANQVAQRAYNSDQLDRKVITRQEEWRNLDQRASFTRTNPPSALVGTLGNQATVRSGVSVQESERNAQVALWEGHDAETTPVTVTLGPVVGVGLSAQQFPEVPGSPTGPWVFPYGIIQFGTRGFATNFEVDIGLGCQFTLTASMVSVQVALEPPPAGFPADDVSLNLAGMLSFGPTNRVPCPVTRTRFVNVTTVAPVVVAIPAFAKRVWIVSTFGAAPPAPATLRLDFLTSQGFILYTVPVAGINLPDPIIIANGIYQVQLTATGGNNFVGGLIFELEF